MPRNMFHNNNHQDFAPQNYHFQQMNGNQLVNRQSPPPCNCIKLKFCNPVMDMARQMYSGFIADYINTQLQVIQCNFIDGEMAVCCPSNINNNNNVNRHGGHDHDSQKWVWGSENTASSEESQQPNPQQYPQTTYTSYPIQGFYPYAKNPFLNKNKAFYASHEDPLTLKNCPPAFSNEFQLPKNHTYYKEPKQVTTPVSRIEEETTRATPNVPPEMQAKMHLINGEACGRSVGSRIIGGEDAGVGRFSWMGRLAYRNKSS